MNCQWIDERLDDFVDGTLPEGEHQEVELHLASCAGCREQARGLQALLARAQALPRELTPSRDLWAGVAARIASQRRTQPRWWTPVGLALAAALVAAVGLALRQRVDPRPRATPAGVGVGTPVSYASGAPLGAAEAEYERAATSLMAAIEERRETLSPETLEGIRKNMEVIDTALAEVRAALERDPGNRELTRMLVATHRKKVDTLRRIVRLSTAA